MGLTDHSLYDLAVVGGGIVGVATAREVARRHPNMRVLLLEKELMLSWCGSGVGGWGREECCATEVCIKSYCHVSLCWKFSCILVLFTKYSRPSHILWTKNYSHNGFQVIGGFLLYFFAVLPVCYLSSHDDHKFTYC